MSFVRKVINDIQIYFIGIIDAKKIEKLISINKFNENEKLLKDAYTHYVNSVSSANMAISLSTAALCKTLVEKVKPKSILDLGSGFSSYIFRSYSKYSNKVKCQVTSIDDSEYWLKKTGQYLLSNKLNTDNLISWENFVSLKENNKFDFILHDIGDVEMKLRTEALSMITKLLNSSGMILLDDMHKTKFRPYAYNFMKSNGFRVYSARKYTFDSYGRFSAIAM